MKKTVAVILTILMIIQIPALSFSGAEYNPDVSDWIPYSMPDMTQIKGTAIDASVLLPAPAGGHGGVTVKGDSLVFQDGTPAKFWGTNVAGQSCFLEHEASDMIADTAASYGYNMVRLHHLDSTAFVPNIFGTDADNLDRSRLDPSQMEKFNYLWARLKEKGIYIFLDFMGIRHLSYDDAVKLGYDSKKAEELSKAPWAFTAIKYFDPDLQDIQKNYMKQLLTYKNPYTGTTLAQDPAFAACCIANEDTLFKDDWVYYNIYYSDYFRNVVCTQFAEWLKDKYKTDDALRSAWYEDGKKGLSDGDSVDGGYVFLDNGYFNDSSNLSAAKKQDIRNFFEFKMSEYYAEMKRYLKEELNIKAIVSGSNTFGINSTSEILSYIDSDMDFVDQHTYYGGGYGSNYLCADCAVGEDNFTSLTQIGSDDKSMASYCAHRSVYNKPVFQSEWNAILPNEYATEANYYMAAYGAFNKWNPIHYNLIQEKWIPSHVAMSTIWSSWHQPLYSLTSCAASYLILGNHVSAANGSYYSLVSDADAMKADFMPEFPKNAEFKAKTGIAYSDRLTKEEIYHIQNNNEKTEKSLTGDTTVSDTNELSLNANSGLFTVNTPKSKVAAGFNLKNGVKLDGVLINSDNGYAAVAVTALDGLRIENSKRILVTATARARNTGMRYSDDGKTMISNGQAPILLEPVNGTVSIDSDINYAVYALDFSGKRKARVPAVRDENGNLVLHMGGRYQTVYYELAEDGGDTGCSVSIDYVNDKLEITGDAADCLVWITDKDGKVVSLVNTGDNYENGSVKIDFNTKLPGEYLLNVCKKGETTVRRNGFRTNYTAPYAVGNALFTFNEDSVSVQLGIMSTKARKKLTVYAVSYDKDGKMTDIKSSTRYVSIGSNNYSFDMKYEVLGTYKIFVWDGSLSPVLKTVQY